MQMMRTQFAAGRSHSERLTLYVLSRLPTEFQACPNSDVETVIVGGGAAGIAAARRLDRAGIKCLIVEAFPFSAVAPGPSRDPRDLQLDLGCGWLHSADRNPWVAVAEEQHRHDRQNTATLEAAPAADWISGG